MPELVGCVVFQERPIDEQDSKAPTIAESYLFSHLLYVLNIAVYSDFQKHGIGSLLLNTCIQAARENELCAGVVKGDDSECRSIFTY